MNAAIPLACPLAWLDQGHGSLGSATGDELREGTDLLLCSSSFSPCGSEARS